MSLNSCLDACNLSAKCMMKFLTASESTTPLGSLSNFKNDCGEGCTFYSTVSTCNYHVTLPLHIADDGDAMLNIFSIATKTREIRETKYTRKLVRLK